MGKRLRVSCIAALGLAWTSTVARAAIAPISVTGFNQDFVVEASATNDPTTHYANAVTSTMDGATAKTGTTYYQTGLAGDTAGLPAPGTATSAADGSTFTLQSFSGPNVLQVSGTGSASPATLAFTNPSQKYSTLAVYGATGSANGNKITSVVIHFSDGTADTASTVVPNVGQDWFGGTGVALGSLHRVDVPSGAIADTGTNPNIYEGTLDLTSISNASTHPISSLTFTFDGGGQNVIFAVSGTVVPEPASLGVLGLASLGLLARRRA